MDHSLSSISYQGSIVEAITEAKRHKKLFVVYISGDNAESGQLEGSTWKNPAVADSVLKYCILLHISEGTKDATNFSALYPQKSAPCITAVGYNGVQLWQNEGFIDAESLASSLQKAWLSLHFQETLTAALASNHSAQIDANKSSSTTFEQGSSSGMNIVSPSLVKNPESLESGENDEMERENNLELNHSDKDLEEIGINIDKMESLGSAVANTFNSSTKRSKTSLTPEKSVGNNTEQGVKAIENKCDNIVDEKSNSEIKTETSRVRVDQETEGSRDKTVEIVEEKKLQDSETSQERVNKETEGSGVTNVDDVQEMKKIKKSETLSNSNEVHLNIRVFDGTTLQNKFLLSNTLKMVKQFVDANQSSVMGSYDLAVPYPRKVFNDKDLNRTLAELSLVGRQALIVVAHNQNAPSSFTKYSDSPNNNSEGYFSSAKRLLSYVNPLAYLGGGASSSSSAQETPRNSWKYGAASPSNQKTPETGGNDSNKQAPLRFGSNIHTLKRDEDDSRDGDRNKFWNGNSTEYGGDSDPK